MKKLIIRLLVVAVVAAAGWYGYRFVQQMPQRQQQVATTSVRQGDVVIRAFARGELRAVRSATITAPNLFGTVQVTKLAPLGSLAKEKDLIVEFDDSERRAALEETMLEVEQIDEQIKQKRAELAVRNNQDQVDLLKARYSVRRAELEKQRNPLLSEIDQKKNLLNLDETRRRLKQLESDIKSRQEQAQAELNVLRETRGKSMIDVAREKQRIAQTRMLSPMTGLVAVKQNRSSVMFFGQQLPDIREGDTLQPGMPVADVLDLSELEVVAKVGELDRANLHEGQDVVMELDAVPGRKFHGKIKGMSGTASANVWSGDPAKKFDVIFSIDMRQLLTDLGAKPEQIRRILETAERNAKKAPPAPAQTLSVAMFGGPGGPPAGGAAPGTPPPGAGGAGPAMAFGAPAGQAEGAETPGEGERGARRGGRFGMGGGAQMSEEERKKFREAFQKELGGKNPMDLSPEERQKVVEKARKAAGIKPAAPGAGARPAGGPSMDFAGFGAPGLIGTEEERANAQLPVAPEEDTQLDVLLRPGLLADVEIIIEKIPNAVHIPNQALFEKEGQLIAYVKTGGRFEPRTVRIVKRSESTVVIKDGLKPGEIVALADPNVRKTDQKSEKKGASPMPGMGGGADRKK